MFVLLVEDHTDTRTLLGTLLSRCGCQVVPAKDLKHARALVREMNFDFLISDLNLPDGDGLEIVREAKRLQTALKAIAVTGRSSDEERDQGLKAGFDYYLTKPIDLHELRQILGVSAKPAKQADKK
jgi:DNA-binding response OmpR family regulator